jgi:hypothetical protein
LSGSDYIHEDTNDGGMFAPLFGPDQSAESAHTGFNAEPTFVQDVEHLHIVSCDQTQQ